MVESSPGISTTYGVPAAPAGLRRFAYAVPPGIATSSRSAVGSSRASAVRVSSTERSVASRARSRSTIQTNLPKCRLIEARRQAWPAVSRWPASSASRANPACSSAVLLHSGSHRSQVSIRAIVASMSL